MLSIIPLCFLFCSYVADVGKLFFTAVEKAEHLPEHRFVFFFHRVAHNFECAGKAFVVNHAARAHKRHLAAFLRNGKAVFNKERFPAFGVERFDADVYGFA